MNMLKVNELNKIEQRILNQIRDQNELIGYLANVIEDAREEGAREADISAIRIDLAFAKGQQSALNAVLAELLEG